PSRARLRTREDHFPEGPLEREIMAGKGVDQDPTAEMEPRLLTVVIQALVDHELEVGYNCLAAIRAKFLEDLRGQCPELFHQRSVAEELPRGEHVGPPFKAV